MNRYLTCHLFFCHLFFILLTFTLGGCAKKQCPEGSKLFGESGKELVCLNESQKIHGKHVKWQTPEIKLFEKLYHDGQLDGPYLEYYQNGQVKIDANYVKGALQGPYRMYYSNGKLKVASNYSAGNLSGAFKSYHKNGKIKEDGNYNQIGKKIGTFVYYRDNGHKIREEIYSEMGGTIVGRRLWKADGTPDAIMKQ